MMHAWRSELVRRGYDEDCIQEALIKFLTRKAESPPIHNPIAWLARVTYRLHQNEQITHSRHRQQLAVEPTPTVVPAPQLRRLIAREVVCALPEKLQRYGFGVNAGGRYIGRYRKENGT